MVTSYEGLHYDVLNIARQEVAMGYETLVAMRDTTDDTEFVSANLIDVNTGKPLFDPYVIKDYGNMRVGIMGLLRPADFPPHSSGMDTTNLRAEDFLETANKYLPVLERKCDAVMVLAELPTADVDALVEAHPEIDLIISTGALRTGEQLSDVGKTKVVGTGSSGYNGHWISMEFDPAWGDSVAYDSFRDQLTDKYEEEGEWSERLADFEGKRKAEAKKSSPRKVNKISKNQLENSKSVKASPSKTAKKPDR
jgi:2',3'-cyclic-nucleotide 2'-phosphodiesterase (5'-nucleotidase family)